MLGTGLLLLFYYTKEAQKVWLGKSPRLNQRGCLAARCLVFLEILAQFLESDSVGLTSAHL